MNWFPYDNGLRHGRVKKVFVLIQQKKNTSLGNSDYRADQKAVRYDDDNTLEILRANLELKHMFITLPSAILLFCRRLMNIH